MLFVTQVNSGVGSTSSQIHHCRPPTNRERMSIYQVGDVRGKHHKGTTDLDQGPGPFSQRKYLRLGCDVAWAPRPRRLDVVRLGAATSENSRSSATWRREASSFRRKEKKVLIPSNLPRLNSQSFHTPGIHYRIAYGSFGFIWHGFALGRPPIKNKCRGSAPQGAQPTRSSAQKTWVLDPSSGRLSSEAVARNMRICCKCCETSSCNRTVWVSALSGRSPNRASDVVAKGPASTERNWIG